MSQQTPPPNNPFEEMFKPLVNMINQANEQINLIRHCSMRRFYLVRDTDDILKNITVAEGIIFGDGLVVLRSTTMTRSTTHFNNIQDLLAIHGRDGKAQVKYIDAEPISK